MIDEKIFIIENTNSNYNHTTPEVKLNKPLDFDILISSNFGLSAFFINKNGRVERTFKDNQPYYSAVATEDYFILGGSFGPLSVVSRHDNGYQYDLNDYCVSAIFKNEKDIYVVASIKSIDVNNYSVYLFNPKLSTLTPLTPPIFGDVRGGCVYKNLLVLPEGDKKRICVWNMTEKKITKIFNGFRYPNDITLTPRNTFLVANEHNNEILEVDLFKEKIIRSSPIGELTSPGSVLEIDRGNYKGHWLISDTDHDRVIIVNPKTWNIAFEARNLNGPLSAVPVWK